MFRHILVPTDFSETSDAALDYGLELAARFNAQLHLLHVIDAPAVLPAGLFDDVKAKLARRAARGQRCAVTTEVITGTSARTIVCYARARSMDLIVMGTHGRSGMAHLLMGSVAEKVVRDAPCPVLTVRHAPSGLDQAELLDPVPDLIPIDAQ
jgi:nucleotide-binding universal stress UspA family protein